MNTCFLTLNCFGILLTLLVLWKDSKEQKESGWSFYAVVCAGLIAAGIFFLRGWQNISPELVTPLFEGTSLQNIYQLYAEAVHSGHNFLWLTHLSNAPGALRLQSVVCLNIALMMANCMIFLVIAIRSLKSIMIPIILGIAFFKSPLTEFATFSELPSALLTMYFWMGILAVDQVQKEISKNPFPFKRNNTRILPPFLLLSIATVLAGFTRLEYSGFGIPALLMIFIHCKFGDHALEKLEHRILSSISKFFIRFSFPNSLLTIILTLGISSLLLYMLHHPERFSRDLIMNINAVNPFDLSIFTLPFFLAVVLPFSIIILFLLGMVYSVRNWHQFCLLPIAVLVFYKLLYHGASSKFFGMIRLMTMLNPIILFISIWGWKEIEHIAIRQQWNSNWKKIAITIMIILFCVPPVVNNPLLLERSTKLFPETAGVLINRNMQYEIQFLLESVARFPDCVFITSVAQRSSASYNASRFVTVVFGQRFPAPMIIQKNSESLSEILTGVSGNPPQCVLFYSGLDCQLDHPSQCESFTSQSELIDEKVFLNRPYCDTVIRARPLAEIHLQLYRVFGLEP